MSSIPVEYILASITALAGAIGYLFAIINESKKACEKERIDCQTQHRELLERIAKVEVKHERV